MSAVRRGARVPLWREAWATLCLILATHWRRPRGLLLTASGFLVGSLTLTVLLAVPAGLERAGASTGLDDVALVLASGAANEAESDIAPATVDIVRTLPQVRRSADGLPEAIPVLVSGVRLPARDGRSTSLQVRGVPPAVRGMLDDAGAVLSAGMPPEGQRSLLLGAVAAQRLAHASGGSATLPIRTAQWRIAGTLDSGGGFWDSEAWMPLSDAQAVFSAPGRVSALWVRLESAAAFGDFRAAVAADPRLQGVRTVRQRAYYASQMDFLVRFIRIAAMGIALLLGTGAALAIGNALNLAVSSREREMATLRALGFSDRGVVLANALELLLVAACATLVTLGVAWLALDGRVFATSTGSQAVYASLELTGGVAAGVLGYNLLVGAAAAVLPLRRLARRSVAAALAGV